MFKFRRDNLVLERLQHVRNMVLINESRSRHFNEKFLNSQGIYCDKLLIASIQLVSYLFVHLVEKPEFRSSIPSIQDILLFL